MRFYRGRCISESDGLWESRERINSRYSMADRVSLCSYHFWNTKAGRDFLAVSVSQEHRA